ncbi:hypothetical protein BpHYR1_054388 [Brachionus plicatilis]|uniref:Uncharacterized protein n=1 Tax=Brachionus plicatilis TaxID=10195 RepID=A0A3M7QIC0_BRAPC|nr:hypothetical protein BpHYR1_054388 [Brachionus plicatilis]
MQLFIEKKFFFIKKIKTYGCVIYEKPSCKDLLNEGQVSCTKLPVEQMRDFFCNKAFTFVHLFSDANKDFTIKSFHRFLFLKKIKPWFNGTNSLKTDRSKFKFEANNFNNNSRNIKWHNQNSDVNEKWFLKLGITNAWYYTTLAKIK